MAFVWRLIFRFIGRYVAMFAAATAIHLSTDKERRDELRYWAEYQKARVENYLEEIISEKLGEK